MSLPNYEGLPEGSRWLHFWTSTDERAGKLWLAMQFETVGVAITAAPCLAIEPTAVMSLFDQLAKLPRSFRDDCGVSVRID